MVTRLFSVLCAMLFLAAPARSDDMQLVLELQQWRDGQVVARL